MQRISRKKNYNLINTPFETNINSFKKIIPNGNTEDDKSQNYLINNMNNTKRSNKFLSIQERQKIIREINKSQNKFNLSKPSPQRLNTSKNNSINKNILYVKKRNCFKSRSKEKISNENQNIKLANGNNVINIQEQKILVNKNINNYKIKYKQNNKKEIYQKPINGKMINKISVNLNNAYKKVYKNKNIMTDMNIKNSAQKEKMNCSKMINNNNGSKNLILNLINNYNTQTIKNNDTLNNSNLIKSNNNYEFLQRNKSTSTLQIKFNKNNYDNNSNKINQSNNYIFTNKLNHVKSSNELYINNKSVSTNKNKRIKKPLYMNEDLINFNYNYPKKNNYINVKNLENINQGKINNIKLKYSKRNSENIETIPQKSLYDTNLISNDLINKLVEKDLISFTYNIDKFNYESQKKEKNINNENYSSLKKNKSFIKDDLSRNIKCNLILCLTKSNDKLKRYKTISYISNKDEEENNNIEKEKDKKEFKNKNSRINSYKNIGNDLISKEIVFPSKINRSISFYNSDDERKNSENNIEKEKEKNKNCFINKKLNQYRKFANLYYSNIENNNSENIRRTRSQSKDYYFNYLSKKINNDFLNEDKINKLGKDLYNIDFFNKNKISRSPLKNSNSTSRILNIEKFNIENNKNIQLVTNKTKPDLKLDISNGMHKSQNSNQNLNINTADDGSFNSSNKFEIIEADSNKNLENEINIKSERGKEENTDYQFPIIQNEEIENKAENLNLLPNNNFDIYQNSKIDLINSITNSKKDSNEFISNSKRKKEIAIQKSILSVKFLEEPIKKNYANKQHQLISPILSDILENLNLITPKNYSIVKNQIFKLLINNDNNISIEFVNILYSIGVNQIKFQRIYSKLFKDIDKFYNKKDKSKSIIRTQLMKLCKSNFKKIKIKLENIKNISNDINFIGELINAQMVSKKVGLQCLAHLINKFQRYNSENDLNNKKDEKYLYLNSIINLLNIFGTCVYYYQKEKIRENELNYFENEINKNIELLKEIQTDKKNIDMPSHIKINLLSLIKKSENGWKLTYIEQNKNEILKPIYENLNAEELNNKQYK